MDKQPPPDSEELLRSLVMSLTDLVVSIDLDDRILFYHHGQAAVYDTPVDNNLLIGQRYQEVLPAEFSAKLAGCIPEVTSTLTSQHIQYIDVIDGITHHFSARITPMISPALRLIGCTIVARDVTEQVNARTRQERLYKLENFMRDVTAAFLDSDDPALVLHEKLSALCTLLEAHRTAIYHFHETGRALDLRQEWAVPNGDLQLHPKQITDETLLNTLHSLLVQRNAIHLHENSSDEIARIRQHLWQGRVKSGLLLPFYVDHRVSGFFALGSSTPRQWQPEEISALSAIGGSYARALEKQQARIELIHARDVALQSDRLKSEFMSNMSHEIRTPMTGIMGMLELLRETRTDSTQTDYITIALESAKKLLHIVNDVLDFSKLDAGRVTLEISPVDLRSILHELTELFTPQATRRGLTLTVDVDANLPTQLLGDPTRIHQVLTNLVGNAIKFTEIGGIEIKASAITDHGVCHLRVDVTDTGIGIPADKHQAIFDSFVQADNSTTRRYSGAGLGLAISKQLMILMGGEISVVSEEGVGSTFTIQLPLPVIALTNPALLDEALRRMHILVLDPDPSARLLIAEDLRITGAHVIEMSSFEGALNLMARAAHLGEDVEILILRASSDIQADNAFIDKLERELDLHMPRVILLANDSTAFAQSIAECILPFGAREQLHERLVQIAREERIPLANEAVVSSQTAPEETPASAPLRILLADDSQVNCQLVQDALAQFDYQIDIATNGENALNLFDERDYELILMDVHMPVVDGVEATQRIRSRSDAKAHVPIIAMTASVRNDEQERYLDAGMSDVLGKPFSIAQLRKTVQHWLASKPDN